MSPSPTATHEPGLDPTHLDFTINISPDDFRRGARDRLLNAVNAELDRLDPANRPVGFVLVFASDSKSNISRAVSTATDVVDLLHAQAPDFTAATGFGYWNGDLNNFEFKVFLLN